MVLSPDKNSLSDKIALHTLKFLCDEPKIYSFLQRGSDERQFNTPALNLGISTLCRSKFGEYKEYHTSLDDFSVVTKNGLEGGSSYIKNAILNLENYAVYEISTICEPNLGSRGLISTLNVNGGYSNEMWLIRNFLAYCDGIRSSLQIAEILGVELRRLSQIIEKLLKFELIRRVDE